MEQGDGETGRDYWGITERVIGAAIEVHRHLGPGLLESAYEECLSFELTRVGIRCARQQVLPVRYKGIELQLGYRLDLVVEERLVVELKCVERLLPIHEAQVLTYMRLARFEVGLLVNFHSAALRHGIRRLTLRPNPNPNPSPPPRLPVQS